MIHQIQMQVYMFNKFYYLYKFNNFINKVNKIHQYIMNKLQNYYKYYNIMYMIYLNNYQLIYHQYKNFIYIINNEFDLYIFNNLLYILIILNNYHLLMDMYHSCILYNEDQFQLIQQSIDIKDMIILFSYIEHIDHFISTDSFQIIVLQWQCQDNLHKYYYQNYIHTSDCKDYKRIVLDDIQVDILYKLIDYNHILNNYHYHLVVFCIQYIEVLTIRFFLISFSFIIITYIYFYSFKLVFLLEIFLGINGIRFWQWEFLKEVRFFFVCLL